MLGTDATSLDGGGGSGAQVAGHVCQDQCPLCRCFVGSRPTPCFSSIHPGLANWDPHGFFLTSQATIHPHARTRQVEHLEALGAPCPTHRAARTSTSRRPGEPRQGGFLVRKTWWWKLGEVNSMGSDGGSLQSEKPGELGICSNAINLGVLDQV